MSKIKLKTNIYEHSGKCLLEMEILSQELKPGLEYQCNDLVISTKSYPGLLGKYVYLRGGRSKDNYISIREFDSREEANFYLDKVLDSIKKFCEYEETLY